MVHEQGIQTGCSRSREVSITLVADMKNFVQFDIESPGRFLEDTSRRFPDSDFAGNDQVLKCVADAQMCQNVIKATIEIRDTPSRMPKRLSSVKTGGTSGKSSQTPGRANLS